MIEMNTEVLGRKDLTPLEKLVYCLPWYDKSVSVLAKVINVDRSTVARAVTKLVEKGVVERVRYGVYRQANFNMECSTSATPVAPTPHLPDCCARATLETRKCCASATLDPQ